MCAEIFQLELVTKTTAKGIVATGDHAINMHDLTATHPSIRDAKEQNKPAGIHSCFRKDRSYLAIKSFECLNIQPEHVSYLS